MEEEAILARWNAHDGRRTATERERLIVGTLREVADIRVDGEALRLDLRSARKAVARKAHRELAELGVGDPELAKGELNAASLAADARLAMARGDDVDRFFKLLKTKGDGRLSLHPRGVRDALREKKHEAPESALRSGYRPRASSEPSTNRSDEPPALVVREEDRERLLAAIEAVRATKGAHAKRAGRTAQIVSDHAKGLAMGECRIADLARKHDVTERTLRDEWDRFKRKLLKELEIRSDGAEG